MKDLISLLGILLNPLVAVHAADKPNAILIHFEDLGFSDLGCYGSEIKTPNLD
jgi:arylsulfatase